MRLSLTSILIGLVFAVCGKSDSQEPDAPDIGTAPSPGCADSTVSATGARYRICFPGVWNGELVIYAHGYVPPEASLTPPEPSVGGRLLSDMVTDLGYAFATTSYRANGLVVPEAVLDVVDLVDAIRNRVLPDPSRTFVIGLSEGGLIATLVAERYPGVVDGAVAGCGPIGDFRRQIDYIGDVRVVFDYFFPDVLPGTAVDVPAEASGEWASSYLPAVAAALTADRERTRQLLRVTGVAIDPTDSTTALESIAAVLFYQIVGTADARARLGGQPFGNRDRVYAGSDDDGALNRGVARHMADGTALDRMAAAFETSGALMVPVATLHTTLDPDVPHFHQVVYADKVAAVEATPLLYETTVDRYGHCVFSPEELMAAVAAVSRARVGRASGTTP